MPQPEKVKKHLLEAPYAGLVSDEVRDLTAAVAVKLCDVYAAATSFRSLIDRAADFLDMFVFFSDLDFSLSRLKFVFADFEQTHYNWSRHLDPDEGGPELVETPDETENTPIPIDGGEFYREDPVWLETQARVQNELRRLLLKRDEEDAFWFFDDPFCEESYIQGEVSSNVAEIYADLAEISEQIDRLDTAWDIEAYSHIQDLIEFHTTHHIMVLFRPVQYLIGKDL